MDTVNALIGASFRLNCAEARNVEIGSTPVRSVGLLNGFVRRLSVRIGRNIEFARRRLQNRRLRIGCAAHSEGVKLSRQNRSVRFELISSTRESARKIGQLGRGRRV